MFSAQGAFVRAFGYDVIPGGTTGFEICTTTTTCKIGVAGAAAGQLQGPTGVAVDPVSGSLYVVDTLTNRVNVFASDGAFLRAFGFDVAPGGGTGFETCTDATGCKVGVSGAAAGQLSGPDGAVVDAGGSVYVTDRNNDRISVYGPDGSFLRAVGADVIPGGGAELETCTTVTGCKAGVSGTGAPGQIESPEGVALDGAGMLYVVETGDSRISQLTTDGSFVRAFGADVVPGGGTGFEICTATTGCKRAAAGAGAGALDFPEGIAVAPSGTVYVADASNNRAAAFAPDGAFLNAFGFDVIPGGDAGFEICTTASGCKAGSANAGLGELYTPRGMAVDCRGGIWVGDQSNHRLQRFGEPGTLFPPCPAAPPPGPAAPPGPRPLSELFPGQHVCIARSLASCSGFGVGVGRVTRISRTGRFSQWNVGLPPVTQTSALKLPPTPRECAVQLYVGLREGTYARFDPRLARRLFDDPRYRQPRIAAVRRTGNLLLARRQFVQSADSQRVVRLRASKKGRRLLRAAFARRLTGTFRGTLRVAVACNGLDGVATGRATVRFRLKR